MKKIALSLLLSLSLLNIFSNDLNVFVDETRFLDEDKNTILEINYQVPYRELQFERTENGFVAQLEVSIILQQEDNNKYDKTFTNQIIMSTFEKTVSRDFFLDKIKMTMSKPGFVVMLKFVDLNSHNSNNWKSEIELLNVDSILSDLELSTIVRQDTTNFLPKFHRQDTLFIVNPSHIYELPRENFLFVFYEIRNLEMDKEKKYNYKETIQIKKRGTTIDRFKSQFTVEKSVIRNMKKIDLSNYKTGLYDIIISIEDKNVYGKSVTNKKDYFSIKKEVNFAHRIFPDMEDEYHLVQYFLSSVDKKRLRSLSDEGKKNFLERFWASNDPNPVTEDNEYLEEVRDRVEYCNKHFSCFKEGWETDRGRIYIKNGSPDELKKLETSFDTNENPDNFGTVPSYTKYTIKDYQIWIYRINQDHSYVFLDLQANGNYKLIYSKNDDDEVSMVNWENYLGSEFDHNLLD